MKDMSAEDRILQQLAEGYNNTDFEILNKYEKTVAMSLMAMIMETYCAEHNLDVVEMIRDLADVAEAVNIDLGKYDPHHEMMVF